MNESIWSPPKDAAVEHALAALGWRNLLPHIWGQLILSSIIAWESYAARIDLGLIVAWSLLCLLSVGLLFWVRRRFARVLSHDFSQTDVSRTQSVLLQWRWLHTAALCGVGISWGTVVVLMSPGAELHNFSLMLAYVGALAYSAMSNAPHAPGGFFLSASIPTFMVLLRLPSVFVNQAIFMAAMIGIYIVSLVLAAQSARIQLLNAVRLRIANEDLAKTNAATALRAEQANRDKSEFLAAASHDLRQPVHALMLLVEAYRQQVPAQAQHPLLQSISLAGQSINGLFNALMELSRLESGAERLNLSVFSLSSVAERVLARHQPEAQRKGLKLRSKISGRTETLLMESDQVLIERLLSNLLSNAVRYTERGGVLFTIAPLAGGLAVSVWDTGLGISQDDQTRIFDPYFQISNPERDRSKGLGLGLAIVRQSVALLGMQLQLRSQLGAGSRFRLEIPSSCLRQAANLDLAQIHTTPAPIQTERLNAKRVLLIDDDPMVMAAMKSLLSGWGMVVSGYSRVDEAFWREMQLCAEQPEVQPHFILSDFRLPGSLDGIALLDRLQEIFPHSVSILLTGEQAASVQEQAEDSGYLVLYKPVLPAVLASTLQAVQSL